MYFLIYTYYLLLLRVNTVVMEQVIFLTIGYMIFYLLDTFSLFLCTLDILMVVMLVLAVINLIFFIVTSMDCGLDSC